MVELEGDGRSVHRRTPRRWRLSRLRLANRSDRAVAVRIILAVLPFVNNSGDEEQDYLSDGMTDEMIAQLGTLQPSRLGVIARTSAMHYKGTTKRADEIASELGAHYVLEGSIRRAGDKVRIAAQLIDARKPESGLGGAVRP